MDSDKGTPRTFRVQILAYELDPDHPEPGVPDHPGATVLAGIGHTLQAEGFAEAVNGPFTTWLERQWDQLQESAHLADQDTGGTRNHEQQGPHHRHR